MKIRLKHSWCDHKKGEVLDVDIKTYEVLKGYGIAEEYKEKPKKKAPEKPEKNKMMTRSKSKVKVK